MIFSGEMLCSVLSYTIEGKTADWTAFQQIVTNNLHKKGKPEKITAVHKMLYQGLLMKSLEEGKIVLETAINAPLSGLPLKGEIHKVRAVAGVAFPHTEGLRTWDTSVTFFKLGYS